MLERLIALCNIWAVPREARAEYRRTHMTPYIWCCVHAGTPESFYLQDTYRGEAIRYIESQGFQVVQIDDENHHIFFRRLLK
jgi:hypothetical protein